ncbi:MAG: hypothetical protein RIQ81_39 [Pseudomonadota bacterium]
MNLASLLIEPKFSNAFEKSFAMSAISMRERSLALLYFRISLLIALPPAFLWFTGFAGAAESIAILSWLSIHTIIAALMVLRHQKTDTLRYTALATMYAAQIAWFVAARIDLADGSGSRAFALVWISYVFISNLLLPFRALVHMVMFVFVMATSSFVLWSYPDNPYGIGATFIALTIAQNVQIFAHRAFKLGMIKQFKEQSRYIPQQVLLQAARENKSIEAVFGPRIRFCVCICSDWRNFQEVAKEIDPQQLGGKLSSYYDRIVDRLQKDLPDGNYFMDWIADELFVVLFSNGEEHDPELVDAGFDFASWLLNHRRRFSRACGYPKGIDVGISAGLASVGIFGPFGSGKATAFGSVPGTARRLQSLAKQFRSDYGDQDRLVLSEQGAALIDADRAQFSKVALKGPYAVKDVSDAHVYVWPKVQSIQLIQRGTDDVVVELTA